MRYYAVKNGRIPGVYTDLSEYKRQVDNFPMSKGRRFSSREAAEEYVKKKVKIKEEIKEEKKVEENHEATIVKDTFTFPSIAYTDGSYNESRSKYGWGVVFMHETSIGQFYGGGGGSDRNLSDIKQQAGEMFAIHSAIEIAWSLGVEKLHIFYDCESVVALLNNEELSSNLHMRKCQLLYRHAIEKFGIVFCKVKAHSGDPYNELADKLAKKGAGIIE